MNSNFNQTVGGRKSDIKGAKRPWDFTNQASEDSGGKNLHQLSVTKQNSAGHQHSAQNQKFNLQKRLQQAYVIQKSAIIGPNGSMPIFDSGSAQNPKQKQPLIGTRKVKVSSLQPHQRQRMPGSTAANPYVDNSYFACLEDSSAQATSGKKRESMMQNRVTFSQSTGPQHQDHIKRQRPNNLEKMVNAVTGTQKKQSQVSGS